MNTTAVILAGGKSSRMGENKALLPMKEKTNIAKIAGELEKVTKQLLIVTNTPEDYCFLGYPMTTDQYPGLGPLAGIHAGLSSSGTEVSIAVACDMPFIHAGIAQEMLDAADGYDAVVPEIEGRLQPLFAVYKKSCLPVLTSCLDNHVLKVREFLAVITVKIMKEQDFRLYEEQPHLFSTSFFNMNMPEDYHQAKQLEEELGLLNKNERTIKE